MKRLSFLLLALTALTLTPRIANSQPMQKGQLSLHAGAAFPQGEFGATDEDDENSGFATTGLTVAGEYTYPIGTPGLGIIGSISVTANGMNENELFEGVDEDDEVDVSSGYWINVPVMGGLRYETEVSPTADLYGVGQVGININRGPTVEASDDDVSTTISHSTVTSTGFTIGAGVAFSDQIDVSIRYLKLGTPEITREAEVQFEGETQREEEEYDQPLAAIQLLVGFDL